MLDCLTNNLLRTYKQKISKLLAYREQMRFVNGSGHVPVRPVVHDLVIESCAGLSAGMFGWQSRFKGSYEARVQSELSGLKELEA